MSLDVYLTRKRDELPAAARAAALLRSHGFDEFASELECRHDTSDSDQLFSANITHNLGRMASEAGIYEALWRPGEMLAPEIGARIAEQSKVGNYHKAGGVYELERTLPPVHARDLIEPLRVGLEKLRSNRKHYESFNSPNGWGLYENFVPWVARYLGACEEHPDAEVSVSR